MSKRPGCLLFALGVAVVVIGLVNLAAAAYHILHSDAAFELASRPSSAVARTNDGLVHRQQARPPLDSLVQGWNITGDVSWLLDFAIVGFPKCGTSSIMYHLKNHSQIDIFGDERCDLAYNKQVLLSQDLYQNMSHKKCHGLKCPMDLESTGLSLRNYHQFFPRTRFLVGIRHPVLWFESFYNFRIHNGFSLPPPTQLIGRCRKKMKNVCTFRGNFHLFLANLGKTRVHQNPKELDLFDQIAQRSLKPMDDATVNRRVFLYEVTQLSDANRTQQFLTDLQQYLGLTQPFVNPMVWFRPGVQHTSKEQRDKVQNQKIDICDRQYNHLRQVLMEQAINSSTWIAEYFVKVPSVTVSSPDYFVKTLMARWKRDPCLG